MKDDIADFEDKIFWIQKKIDDLKQRILDDTAELAKVIARIAEIEAQIK